MVASSPTIHQPLVAKPKTISNHNLLDFSAFLENTSFPVRQKKVRKKYRNTASSRKYYLVSWKKKSKEIRAFQVWLFLAVVRTFVDKTRYLPSTRKRQKIKLFLCLFSLLNSLYFLSKWQQIKDCEIVDIGHPTKDRISKGHRARVKAKSSVTVFDSRENCLILDQLKFEETSEARTETIKSRTFQPKLWPFPRSFISKWQ